MKACPAPANTHKRTNARPRAQCYNDNWQVFADDDVDLELPLLIWAGDDADTDDAASETDESAPRGSAHLLLAIHFPNSGLSLSHLELNLLFQLVLLPSFNHLMLDWLLQRLRNRRRHLQLSGVW